MAPDPQNNLQQQKLEAIIENLIKNLGYDLQKEDFKGTPERVAKMWMKFLNDNSTCSMANFPTVSSGGIICVKDYHFWSFCPHHLLPVKYKAKIGYIPRSRAFGLSKLGRAAMCVSRLMPLQEDVAFMISKHLNNVLGEYIDGVGVIIQGEHLCMQMRGIKDPCVHAVSDYYTGKMLEEPFLTRFLNL